MHKQKILSVIIPVYNEEKTIQAVIQLVKKVKLPPNIRKEIIIVNDSSTDNSEKIIDTEKKSSPSQIKVFNSAIDLGKGAAVRFGLKIASGDIVIIQDADAELNPAEFPQLIQPILDGKTQVVYGSRFSKKNHGIAFSNRLANWSLTNLTNILFNAKLTDMETAYKVFTKHVKEKLKLSTVGFDFEPEITIQILKNGFSIYEVPITYIPRKKIDGKKIGFWDGVIAVLTLIKNR